MSTQAKKIFLGLVLADFAALTGWAVYVHGYAGFFELVGANLATVTVLVDLCIALSLVTLWMWNDARERGVSPIPYVVLTLTLGSIGPLLYLIRREGAVRASAPRLAERPARA
jgi:hypothetical protein